MGCCLFMGDVERVGLLEMVLGDATLAGELSIWTGGQDMQPVGTFTQRGSMKFQLPPIFVFCQQVSSLGVAGNAIVNGGKF